MSEGRDLTDANPPLLARDRFPANRILLSAETTARLVDLPPMTPSLTICHRVAELGSEKSNSVLVCS